MIGPKPPTESPDWLPLPGEPHFQAQRAQRPDGSYVVAVTLRATEDVAQTIVIRPAVARWLGNALVGLADLAESRIIIPDVNGGPPDRPQSN